MWQEPEFLVVNTSNLIVNLTVALIIDSTALVGLFQKTEEKLPSFIPHSLIILHIDCTVKRNNHLLVLSLQNSHLKTDNSDINFLE